MMKRSLYWKFVFIFIIGVGLSVIISYAITTHFFQNQTAFKAELNSATQGVTAIIETVDPEEHEELLPIFEDLGLAVEVLSHEELVIFGLQHKYLEEPLHESEINTLTSRSARIIDYTDTELRRDIVTLVDVEGEPMYARITLDYYEDMQAIRRLMIQVLIFVLLSGSVIILFISRYFVRSIQQITRAAEQLTYGDFEVNLKTEREDELGQLMEQFNQMAQALKNVDEMRKTFVSNVSHEIQSPLTSIKGYTRAIKDGVVSVDQQDKYLGIIYDEADRLSRLSEHLLKMTKLDQDAYPINKQPYRLDEQIRRIVLKTEPQWQEKHILVELNLEPLTLALDEDLMEQVWLNLIVNAIRYNKPGGSIYINHYQEESNHVFRINDTGIGIPDEEIPFVFDRFYKVDSSRTGVDSGSGLGLSIVKRIVMLHEGRTDCISQEGVGTTFFVRLPKS